MQTTGNILGVVRKPTGNGGGGGGGSLGGYTKVFTQTFDGIDLTNIATLELLFDFPELTLELQGDPLFFFIARKHLFVEASIVIDDASNIRKLLNIAQLTEIDYQLIVECGSLNGLILDIINPLSEYNAFPTIDGAELIVNVMYEEIEKDLCSGR